MPIFATWEQPEGSGGSIRWVEDFRLAMLPFTKVSMLILLTYPLKLARCILQLQL